MSLRSDPTQMELNKLVSPNIEALKAYHVEHHDCPVKLHANENSFSLPSSLFEKFGIEFKQLNLNRYPDPDSQRLKETLAKRFNLSAKHFAIGNGSDELIQTLIQIFCDSSHAVAFPEPTFAMYGILAQSLGVPTCSFPLDENWDFNASSFLDDPKVKKARMVFISYPNNPTGNCFSEEAIQQIIDHFPGIVVIDEAYFDFSDKSFVKELETHNNLVILRSLSKVGLAALRVGYAIANPYIIEQIDKVRLPYNVNMISQAFARCLIENFDVIKKQIKTIQEERSSLFSTMQKIKGNRVFHSDSNFILFKTHKKSSEVFDHFLKNGILIRDLGSNPKLRDCLRVTVGTPEENRLFEAHLTTLFEK